MSATDLTSLIPPPNSISSFVKDLIFLTDSREVSLPVLEPVKSTTCTNLKPNDSYS